MRQYKQLLQHYLRDAIYAYRKDRDLSQDRMAEVLRISPRSYIDQEHLKYSFSALSLIFFLLALTEDEVLLFLRGFRQLVEQEAQHGEVA